MAAKSSSPGGLGQALIGAAAVVLAALIGAAAIVWQTSKSTGEPSSSASGTTQVANSPTLGCQSRGPASEISVTPSSARTGDTVTISGNGFPDAAKVYLAVSGNAPNYDVDLGHIATRTLDACARFEYPWTVPPYLAQSGHRRFRIDATGQDPRGNDISDSANSSNTEFTLMQ